MNTPTTTTVPAVPRTRPLLIAASIPSALSLAWTAWSVADMIPAPTPIAIAAGVALDVALVAAVAIAWVAPTIARGAQTASWITASIAAAAIAVHSWEISPALALMAAVPLISKLLWGLALKAKASGEAAAAEAAARAAAQAAQAKEEADRKEQRLSTGLTEDQEAELAELERQAAYVKAKADRQVALEQAKAQAAQQLRLAEIEREAETQMATDEATAQIHVRRAELAHRIQLAAPVYSVTELPVGGQQVAPQVPEGVPTTPTDTDPEQAETERLRHILAALAEDQIAALADRGTDALAAMLDRTQPPTAEGAPRPDLRTPPGAPSTASPNAPGGAPRAEETLDGPQRLLAYIASAGEQATVKGAAREMGVHPRTIRRYRERLIEAGHDMSALGADQ